MKLDRRKIGWFLFITFALNWTLAEAFFFVMGAKPDVLVYAAMAAVYMMIPALSAVVVQTYIYKQPLRDPLRLKFKFNRWFVFAWLLPPVLSLAALLVTLLFPGVSFEMSLYPLLESQADFLSAEQVEAAMAKLDALPVPPGLLIPMFVLQGLVAGATINAVAGFGEELGWRGFLLREMECLGFWRSSLWIGIIWGVWHAPLILRGHNYPDSPMIGVAMMVVMCVLLSPLFSFVTQRANSVFAPSIMHGTVNATASLSVMFFKEGSSLFVGLSGLAGCIVLVVVNLILWKFGRPGDTSCLAEEIA